MEEGSGPRGLVQAGRAASAEALRRGRGEQHRAGLGQRREPRGGSWGPRASGHLGQ